MAPLARARARPGRPPKFGRPARAVALTLPEDVISALSRLDDDLARAVVRLSEPLVAEHGTPSAVELSQHHDHAVIVVRPIKALERIPGVTLVPLPDGRALISLDEAMSIADFELRLLYALDADGDLRAEDRSVISSIAEILKHARQTRGISLHERSIIVLKVGAGRRLRRTAEPVSSSKARRLPRERTPHHRGER